MSHLTMFFTLSYLVFSVMVAHISAEQSWLGNWESTDKPAENLYAFLQALNLPVDQFGGTPKTFLNISKQGDQYTSILSVPSKPNLTTKRVFTIGEEVTQVEPIFNNVEVKFRYSEEGNKLNAEVKLPSINKVVHNCFEVINNELVKGYELDGIKGKRWFKKAA